jgi:hypothetical protein
MLGGSLTSRLSGTVLIIIHMKRFNTLKRYQPELKLKYAIRT